jgi:anti-sigma28 factor (negative regulator of flagellin synthesis)
VHSERADNMKRSEVGAAGLTSGQERSDAVHLSADAPLAAKAAKAANMPDPARADKIERAKKLLAGGELGTDANRLADAIIASIIASNGQRCHRHPAGLL